MELKELVEKVEQWSIDRGLDKADSKKQLLKLYEEFGELASGIAKNKPDVIKDSIGDCVVVVIILAQQEEREIIPGMYASESLRNPMLKLAKMIGQFSYLSSDGHFRSDAYYNFNRIIRALEIVALEYNVDFEECLDMAWNAIKDRKGKMVNGVFVKEEDLAEQTLEAVVEADMVMKPNHYQGKNGLEVITVLDEFSACPEYMEGYFWGNTMKYLTRYHKKNGVQDLKKALRHLVWFIARLSDKTELAKLLREMAEEVENG